MRWEEMRRAGEKCKMVAELKGHRALSRAFQRGSKKQRAKQDLFCFIDIEVAFLLWLAGFYLVI